MTHRLVSNSMEYVNMLHHGHTIRKAMPVFVDGLALIGPIMFHLRFGAQMETGVEEVPSP